jgi:hypothetical protein
MHKNANIICAEDIPHEQECRHYLPENDTAFTAGGGAFVTG